MRDDGIGIEVNGTVFTWQSTVCSFCIKPNETCSRHWGYFVAVPKRCWRVWFQKIEKIHGYSLSTHFTDEFHKRVMNGNARVAIVHIVLINDSFIRENPMFIENSDMWENIISPLSSIDQRKIMAKHAKTHQIQKQLTSTHQILNKLQKQLNQPITPPHTEIKHNTQVSSSKYCRFWKPFMIGQDNIIVWLVAHFVALRNY